VVRRLGSRLRLDSNASITHLQGCKFMNWTVIEANAASFAYNFLLKIEIDD
jgi:hypothetical protein